MSDWLSPCCVSDDLCKIYGHRYIQYIVTLCISNIFFNLFYWTEVQWLPPMVPGVIWSRRHPCLSIADLLEMQPLTLHLKKTHGWYCKVREKKTVSLNIFCGCISAGVKSPFLFSSGEDVAGSVSRTVPRVTSHGGQRTSDHIHGFGGSWWVMMTSHGVKTDACMCRQAWRSLANLSARVFSDRSTEGKQKCFSQPAEKAAVCECVKVFCSRTVTAAVR